MTDLIPWRAEPVAYAGTIRADRLRVRADYPISGVAVVLLAIQGVFFVPVLEALDLVDVGIPVVLALNAVGFGGLWLLRERARRDVGRLAASYGDGDRDGATREPSLAGLLSVSRERHGAIREEWTRALTDPLTRLTSFAASDTHSTQF